MLSVEHDLVILKLISGNFLAFLGFNVAKISHVSDLALWSAMGLAMRVVVRSCSLASLNQVA